MNCLSVVGVGPGDPELLTIKAVKRIRECDCLILPEKEKEACYAYQIVKQILPEIENKEILSAHFPMVRDMDVIRQATESIVDEITTALKSGKKAVFLTIGDPSIYSTFFYMKERIEERGYFTEMISGVPSFVAAAARLGIHLGLGKEEIRILPGAYSREDARVHRTEEGDEIPVTRVYMKSGKYLSELLRHLMEEEGIDTKKVYLVEKCGLPDEKVWIGFEEIRLAVEAGAGYLSLLLVQS